MFSRIAHFFASIFRRGRRKRSLCDELVETHQIRKKASGLGALGQPSPDAAELSEPELTIINDINDRVNHLREELQKVEQRLEEALRNFSPAHQDAVSGLGKVRNTANVERRAERNKVLGEITEAGDNHDRLARDFRRFQQENSVAHLPEYPASIVKHFALIYAIFIVECGINALIYMRALPGGGAEGFIVAFLIAVVNIGAAVTMGFFPLRWLNHCNPHHRRWAIPMSAFLASVILSINSFAAHLRELALGLRGSGSVIDTASIFRRLITQPFTLTTESYALFAIGMIFAVYAVYKGYTASDRYPGYKSVHSRMRKARQAYEKKKVELAKVVEQKCDKAGIDAKAAAKTLEDCNRESLHLSIQLAGKYDNLNQSGHHFCQEGTAAITLFRQINIAVRGHQYGRPKYFHDPIEPEFDFEELTIPTRLSPEEISNEYSDRLEEVADLLKGIQKDCEDSSEELEALFEKMDDRYGTVPTFDRNRTNGSATGSDQSSVETPS